MVIKDQWFLFFQLLRRYITPTAAIIVVNLLIGCILTLRPLVVAPALDALAGAVSDPADTFSSITLNNIGSTLVAVIGLDGAEIVFLGGVVAATYFFISVVVAMLTFFGHYLTVNVRTGMARDLTLQLHRHLLSLPLGYFSNQKPGDLVSRATNDVNVTTTTLDAVTRGIIKSIAQIALAAIILFKTDPLFATVIVGIGALHLLITRLLGATVLRRSRSYVRELGILSAALIEAFNGIRVIKSFAGERYEAKRISDVANNYRGYLREYRIGTFYEVPARMVADAMVATAILVLVFYAVTEQRLTLSAAVLFFYLSQQMSAPMSELFASMLRVQELKGCADRIITTLDEVSAIDDGSEKVAPFRIALKLENVNFAYRPNRPVLSEINLTVFRGEFVAIVGPSGAGKSTLADLMLRFYDPDSGSIRLDGVDIREMRQRLYRQQFGVVAQESLLFNDSIKNNIVYSRAEDMQTLEQALDVANAREFVGALPEGMNTVVGDRGVKLSGGQIQRIALARAVYARPNILLLDEATSSLDSESERAVQDALYRIAEEMTVIAIAHRLSTIMHADKIVVLNEGRVDAIGAHAELLQKCQTYRSLYHHQFAAVSSVRDGHSNSNDV